MWFADGSTMLVAFVVVGLVAGWAVASAYNAVIGLSGTTAAANRTPAPRLD